MSRHLGRQSRSVVLGVAALMVCSAAYAVDGRVSGNVRESNGEFAQGMTVHLLDVQAQIVLSSQPTDDFGFYEIDNIEPGIEYRMVVESTSGLYFTPAPVQGSGAAFAANVVLRPDTAVRAAKVWVDDANFAGFDSFVAKPVAGMLVIREIPATIAAVRGEAFSAGASAGGASSGSGFFSSMGAVKIGALAAGGLVGLAGVAEAVSSDGGDDEEPAASPASP